MAPKTPLVAVVHDGRQGWASPQAFAARDGAAETGARSVLIGVEDLGERQWALLKEADGILFGARPPYAEGCRDWRGRPAAGFTDPHVDPYERLRELCAFADRWGMHWIGMDVPPWWHSGCATEASLDSVRFLGARVTRFARARLIEAGGGSGADAYADEAADVAYLGAATLAGHEVSTAWRRG
ncbi:hypothetical protein [Streptomyces antimicrobicus]|uniref:Uncharacterized protein n=1 Tax=Streptomyces antimicrobicus TaxID=2883108 RepID=A0ABS8B6Q5_9ACTN|nr:hypothetical protein [Streptomyces antimicrobicus]MCB5180298.1 hypothetical protein [Streptomyces antimicrobicus]